MSLNITDIAIDALKNKGIEVTKDKVNSIVASVKISGVNLNDCNAVTACAEVAVDSSMKFDWSKFQKASPSIKKEESSLNTNFSGISCPRCGKPTVFANIMERKVAYCTSGCNIVIPFAE